MNLALKLVAQFAVENRIADKAAVDDCVALIESGAAEPDLPSLLLSKGHIDGAEYGILRRVFPAQGTPESAAAAPQAPSRRADPDILFAKIVAAGGMLPSEFVERGLAELARRRKAGEPSDVRKVMLEMGFLTASQIEGIDQGLSKPQLRCEGCDKPYDTRPESGKCPSCGLSLPSPGVPIPLEIGSAAGKSGTLEILAGTNQGMVYEIACDSRVNLGRNTKNKIRVYGKDVSREHAEIIDRQGRANLVDMGSRFGTFVNGRRVKDVILYDGDLLKIGSTVLEFRAGPAAAPRPRTSGPTTPTLPSGRVTPGAGADLHARFGEIALSKGYVEKSQLEEALDMQKGLEAEDRRKLGEILVSKKFIGIEAVSEILKAQRSHEIPEIKGYQILNEIGSGGMGRVFKACQVSLERIVAIKILSPALSSDDVFIRRFVTEARAAGKLNHPNIIRAIDVGESGGHYYFAMEFVDGETVYEILKKQGAMDQGRTIEIGIQILKALKHAEQHKLVHRDIKPDNIMIDKSGTAKLCDLGLAKATGGKPGETRADEAVGTPNYVSPEQARGVSDVDIRADVYSLGASLYHMATGQIPFRRKGSPLVVMAKHITDQIPNPSRINAALKKDFCRVLEMMMVKDRELRYQHPGDVIEDLERVKRGEPPGLPKSIPKSTISRDA